jgi:stress-induced morphogen
MITAETLTSYVRKSMPDAQVWVTDKTGTMDHLAVRVVSATFSGRNLLDRHRMVYQALNEPMKDGRIHALELKAEAPDER